MQLDLLQMRQKQIRKLNLYTVIKEKLKNLDKQREYFKETQMTVTTVEQRKANRKHPVKRVVDNYGDEVLVYMKTGTVKNPHTKERTRK